MATTGETNSIATESASSAEIEALLAKIVARAPKAAVNMLSPYPDNFVAKMLMLLNSAQAQDVLQHFPNDRRQKILAAAPPETRNQWIRNEAYPERSIGHMMEPALAVFQPETTVTEATRELRHFVKTAFITYVFVTDKAERLVGVVAMREMLLARGEQQLEEVMTRNPFYLTPEMPILGAMKATMVRHYPVYPVCDRDHKLVGLIRGQMLFEAETVELSLQAGSMVGVEKEERLSTPWWRSFVYRHPWLQGNLLLGFIAAAVVGYFEHTIDRLVALAVFLPVLIGQSVNTGCQTLALALRGMTLGELKAGGELGVVIKETLLGLLNGALTGVVAAIAMYIFASMQHSPVALQLSFVVFLAMAGSCLISGVFGAAIPIFMRKIGTDPVTASSIILTTITDVSTLAVFLGLASWLISS
ncbi:MAG TPA: magnesium transporter [Chthoniobacterales bacterium]|nr:magnesium transporter [Chthoniobacterales bacterium]